MITVGRSEVRNLAKEMTLNEWENVRKQTEKVANKSEPFGAIDAWFNIFQMLGADEDDLDTLKSTEFLELIVQFNKEEIEKKFQRTIEINGRTYEAYKEGKEFVLNGKTMAVVERIVKKKGNATFADILAAVFKDSQFSNAEHYDENHVLTKAELFGEVRADIALPYLAEFGVEIAGILKIKEEHGITGELEPSIS